MVVCPPTERGGDGIVLSTARKPEGGFQFLSVAHLCAVWCAYQQANIQLAEVTNLKDQMKDLTQQYQNQISQLILLASDKTKSLNDQIENLKDQ